MRLMCELPRRPPPRRLACAENARPEPYTATASRCLALTKRGNQDAPRRPRGYPEEMGTENPIRASSAGQAAPRRAAA